MTDVLTRLAALDPLPAASPGRDLDGIADAILATPREAPGTRRRLHARIALVAAVLLALAAGTAAAAGGGLGWDAILPGSNADPAQPRPVVDAAQLQSEAEVVHAAIADPPGLTTPLADPNPMGDVGSGEVGAGASQQLYLQMCTWQRAVLEAHATGDIAAETQARRTLADEHWYRYFASPEDGNGVRTVNTDPARLADLRQSWDVNCPGGAYDRNVHPDAPPIGQ